MPADHRVDFAARNVLEHALERWTLSTRPGTCVVVAEDLNDLPPTLVS
jgi:hypothetical protein